MNTLLLLLAFLVGAAVILVSIGLRGLIKEVPLEERNYQDPLPAGLRLLWPLVNVATFLIGPRLRSSDMEKTFRSLQSAGQDYVLKPEEFYGLRVVSAFVASIIFCLFVIVLGRGNFGSFSVAILFGAMVGYVYPLLWLGERRKRRQRQVVRDLPIFLDFVTMAVEAGLNINGAIEQAVLKGPQGPLSQEFVRMLRDLRAGLPRAEALKRLAERMDISQVTSFTTAVIQADRVGASLGATLRAQSGQRREERFLRAEKLALEAPVKMMLPLVMFFFPLIFLVLGYFVFLQMQEQGIL